MPPRLPSTPYISSSSRSGGSSRCLPAWGGTPGRCSAACAASARQHQPASAWRAAPAAPAACACKQREQACEVRWRPLRADIHRRAWQQPEKALHWQQAGSSWVSSLSCIHPHSLRTLRRAPACTARAAGCRLRCRQRLCSRDRAQCCSNTRGRGQGRKGWATGIKPCATCTESAAGLKMPANNSFLTPKCSHQLQCTPLQRPTQQPASVFTTGQANQAVSPAPLPAAPVRAGGGVVPALAAQVAGLRSKRWVVAVRPHAQCTHGSRGMGRKGGSRSRGSMLRQH